MNTLFYISFAYMVIHLSLFFFKKGINYRNKLENEMLPSLRLQRIHSFKRTITHIKYSVKCIFTREARLILSETKKRYNETFSPELIDILKQKDHSKKIYEVLHYVFLVKKEKEFKRFPFVNDYEYSKEIQFYERKREIIHLRNTLLATILKEKYQEGTIHTSEYSQWKSKLQKNGFVFEEPEVKQGVSASHIINKETQTECTEEFTTTVISSSNELEVEKENEEEVFVREVPRKKAARF